MTQMTYLMTNQTYKTMATNPKGYHAHGVCIVPNVVGHGMAIGNTNKVPVFSRPKKWFPHGKQHN
jgi:ApbE superfamily uncharacterized protein (UPF0280 family)